MLVFPCWYCFAVSPVRQSREVLVLACILILAYGQQASFLQNFRAVTERIAGRVTSRLTRASSSSRPAPSTSPPRRPGCSGRSPGTTSGRRTAGASRCSVPWLHFQQIAGGTSLAWCFHPSRHSVSSSCGSGWMPALGCTRRHPGLDGAVEVASGGQGWRRASQQEIPPPAGWACAMCPTGGVGVGDLGDLPNPCRKLMLRTHSRSFAPSARVLASLSTWRIRELNKMKAAKVRCIYLFFWKLRPECAFWREGRAIAKSRHALEAFSPESET